MPDMNDPLEKLLIQTYHILATQCDSVGPSNIGRLPHKELNIGVIQSKLRKVLKEYTECIKPSSPESKLDPTHERTGFNSLTSAARQSLWE